MRHDIAPIEHHSLPRECHFERMPKRFMDAGDRHIAAARCMSVTRCAEHAGEENQTGGCVTRHRWSTKTWPWLCWPSFCSEPIPATPERGAGRARDTASYEPSPGSVRPTRSSIAPLWFERLFSQRDRGLLQGELDSTRVCTMIPICGAGVRDARIVRDRRRRLRAPHSPKD